MKKIILSICLLLMLVFPIFSISAIEGNSHFIQTNGCNPFYERLDVPSLSWLIGADQMLINDSAYGFTQTPEGEMAQSFKPTKNTITAVALYLRKNANPPEQTTFTISIREELDGPDMTNIAIMAKDWKIKSRGTWVLFDFQDITVIPEQTYYIIKRVSHGGMLENTYSWLVPFNNQYPRGEAWLKDYNFSNWRLLWEWFDFDPNFADPDFCFITYYQEPRNKVFFNPIRIYLENHPYLFPILRLILQL